MKECLPAVRLPGPRDVDMVLPAGIQGQFSERPEDDPADEIMVHYTVTENCPFSCRGCINALTAGLEQDGNRRRAAAERSAEELERDIRGVAQLIRTSGRRRAVVVFYGGEPMLRLADMNRVFERLGGEVGSRVEIRYAVVTSGHYLERAIEQSPDLARRMWLTAVSVDGTRAQHEAARRGTSLATIRGQLQAFSRVREGQVLIWSTLRPGMSLWDCFESFLYFRERREAEHFFWHWNEAEGQVSDLPGHLERYDRDLRRIMGVYLEHLSRGRLLSLVHVNELLLYLLTGARRGTTACGVERMANFDIIGDGRVHACADLPEAMSIGRITPSGQVNLDPGARERLAGIVGYKETLGCPDCGVEPYCGGRCPVQAHTGGIERARQYCHLMRRHVATVKEHLGPLVKGLVDQGMGTEDLRRSSRYARYTDVTP